MKLFDQNKAMRIFENEIPGDDWEALSKNISEYLLKLDEKRLRYLSRPPLLKEEVQEFKPLKLEAPAGDDSEPPFYIYLYGKCVSETTGRKVGNVFMNVFSNAVFMSDTGTMIMLYFIDSRTSEVLYIEGKYFGQDLTKPDQLAKVVQMVSAMIRRDEKK